MTEYRNDFPEQYNTISGSNPSMPPVTDIATDAVASQLNSVVEAQVEAEHILGNNNKEEGTVLYRLDGLEAVSGTGGSVEIQDSIGDTVVSEASGIRFLDDFSVTASGTYATVSGVKTNYTVGHEGDTPPSSVHPMSDEFDDSYFNTTGDYPWTWTRAGAPSVGNWAEEKGVVWMKDTNTAGFDNVADWHYAYKDALSGAFEIETRAVAVLRDNYNCVGITIDDGTDTTSHDALRVQYGSATAPFGVSCQWRVSGSYTHEQYPKPTYQRMHYLKMGFDGATTVTFYYSYDGIVWITMGTHTIGYTPARVGFFIHANTSGGSGGQCTVSFDYFRVTAL